MLSGMQVLRVTIMNPHTTEAHLDQLVSGLARIAQTLEPSPDGVAS